MLSLYLVLTAPIAFAAGPYAPLVNEFIGTLSSGNAFPGAAIPHAMAKVGIDVNSAVRQAGYLAQGNITGMSVMHDEGTGGNANGGYGNFPLFPTVCTSWNACVVDINARAVARVPNTDVAHPGYFSSALSIAGGIQLEVTSTRRAALERFTYPSTSNAYLVVDLTNDLGRSFSGGNLTLDPVAGEIRLSGQYGQSYGLNRYVLHGCYRFLPPNSTNYTLSSYGTYSSSTSSSTITFTPNGTSLAFPNMTSVASSLQAGALLGFDFAEGVDNRTVLVRMGISFLSEDQACANAEAEIPDWDWGSVQGASEAMWEEALSRYEVDTGKEDATVVELLYSSLYRHFLTPANLTSENPYWSNDEPFFDALFCSWDTFRTQHPLLSLSPDMWAPIVRTYIDGWRHTGYLPECRGNTQPGYVQGGSDGMPIVGDFAVKYAAEASALGVDLDDLWQALQDTAENTPPNWYTVGRQNTAWKQFGYIPTNWTDPSGSTGLPTREISRSFEYAVGDFAVYQAARTLGKDAATVATYKNRSMNFENLWDPTVQFTTSNGTTFTNFPQRRLADGTFVFSNLTWCAPVDSNHPCARDSTNTAGVYESSIWEYQFFAPQSWASVVRLTGGNDAFISRLDAYFAAGYFYAGNEPGFGNPIAYHYADRPDLSALRIRNVVYNNFKTTQSGIPGNDDSGAMASLLTFHLLGLYPVPSSTELLVASPFVSSYTIHNRYYGTQATVTVDGFDSSSLAASPPSGSKLFVSAITIDGVPQASRCYLSFNVFTKSSQVVITVTDDQQSVASCGVGGLPSSLETGGFQ